MPQVDFPFDVVFEVDPGYIVQVDESDDVDVCVRVEFIYMCTRIQSPNEARRSRVPHR